MGLFDREKKTTTEEHPFRPLVNEVKIPPTMNLTPADELRKLQYDARIVLASLVEKLYGETLDACRAVARKGGDSVEFKFNEFNREGHSCEVLVNMVAERLRQDTLQVEVHEITRVLVVSWGREAAYR